jgi:uncharacterized protein
MEGFGMGAVLGVAALMFVCGAALGYVFSGSRKEQTSGGKTAAQLREELEQYQEKVSQHFEKSAEMFHGLTLQYRDLYQHMAETASDLVDDENRGAALSFRNAILLADASDPALAPEGDADPDAAAAGDAPEAAADAGDDTGEDAELAAATLSLEPEARGDTGPAEDIDAAAEEAEPPLEVAEDDAAPSDDAASVAEAAGEQTDAGSDIGSEDPTVRDTSRG